MESPMDVEQLACVTISMQLPTPPTTTRSERCGLGLDGSCAHKWCNIKLGALVCCHAGPLQNLSMYW